MDEIWNSFVDILPQGTAPFVISILALFIAGYSLWKNHVEMSRDHKRLYEESAQQRIAYREASHVDLMEKMRLFSSLEVLELSDRLKIERVHELIELMQDAIFGRFGLYASHEARETALRLRTMAVNYTRGTGDFNDLLIASYKLHQMLRSDVGVPQLKLKSAIDKSREEHDQPKSKEEMERFLEKNVKHIKWHDLVAIPRTISTSFELIIFDCDGVLVDSEKLANSVFNRIIEEECGENFGLEKTMELFLGQSKSKCMQILEAELGKPIPEQVVERYETDINSALERDVKAVNGVKAMLSELPMEYCVASSGTHSKMYVTLGKSGLLHKFRNRIFSVEDPPVKRGKPFPDVYLHAAKMMGEIPPERVLVIEDSAVGVEGAVSAGMTVFGYAELSDEKDLLAKGAHMVFDDMAKLLFTIEDYESAQRSKEITTPMV